MSTVSFHIANLLEKMTSTDKDFRFMATNDLMCELQKDSIKLDDDSERKVVRMLIKLLEDKNGEVQNLAVKCLSPLITKIKESQVELIIDQLTSNMLTSTNEQLRDISSIGLKTIILELPVGNQSIALLICKKIVGKLVGSGGGLGSQSQGQQLMVASSTGGKEPPPNQSLQIQLESLDILIDLLSKYPQQLLQYHTTLLESLIPLLSNARQAIRKRTILILGYISSTCNSQNYQKIIGALFDQFECNRITVVQCFGVVCKNSGSGRFVEWIDRVVEMLIGCCSTPSTVGSGSSDSDDELKEVVLQALEIMITRHPTEIQPHVIRITELCTKYISYDPNYNDSSGGGAQDESSSMQMDTDDDDTMDHEISGSGENGGGGGSDGGENEDDGGEDEDDEYSDDDDMSWKVRRSSAKTLESLIVSLPSNLLYFYKQISLILIQRFREREETVRCDVINCYRSLLKFTSSTSTTQSDESEVKSLLDAQVHVVVKLLHTKLKEKSMKTRQVSLHLLLDLITTTTLSSTQIQLLLPGLINCLQTSTSNIRTLTLQFINQLYTTQQPPSPEYIQQLLPIILNLVENDSFYKVVIESLNTLQIVLKFGYTNDQIYRVVHSKFIQTDLDQEVKECSIVTMGVLLTTSSRDKWGECVGVFLDRLANEITRVCTVRVLNSLLGSVVLDVGLVVERGLPLLSGYLRKNQRGLRLGSLELVQTLVKRYSPQLPTTLLKQLINELPALLNENDLNTSQQALELMNTLSVHKPELIDYVADVCIESLLGLVKSPLLMMQGPTLKSLLTYLRTLNSKSGKYTTPLLLQRFQHQPTELNKACYYNLAKCVAAVVASSSSCSGGGGNQPYEYVEKFLNELNMIGSSSASGMDINNGNGGRVLICLLSIGEIGRGCDLSKIPNLTTTILKFFQSPTLSEEIKTAASYTFGSIAIGNLVHFLPLLLNEIELQPKKQYLLLHALKEIITHHQSTTAGSGSGISNLINYKDTIWQKLLKHADECEEGIRNIVSECLGKLTLTNPTEFLPKLEAQLESPGLRTTIITAIKFTVTDQPSSSDGILKERISKFLLLDDPDLAVRRVSLVMLNSVLHNKPGIVVGILPEILPKLYRETIVKKDLIREVEMGPFKHSIDDGLDLRKAAYECMYTLLDKQLPINMSDFILQIENGLKDHYDIKMLTYLMVSRLSTICPGLVLNKIDKLLEGLKNTLTLKVKANSVKQEYEKQDELKRAAMRAVVSLCNCTEADKNILLMEFIGHVRANNDLQQLFESIQQQQLQQQMQQGSGTGGGASIDSSSLGVGGGGGTDHSPMFIE